MADQAYETPELCMPSPADSANEGAEHSWYRHSGQTGDFSSGRSNSPINSEWRQSGLFGSKTSSLDPRRITPTLHASLVSEILALRREVENKNSFIDDLESNLQTNKSELDDVNNRLNRLVRESTAQKNKSVESERQLFRVTEELVRERDHAVSNGQDLRTRFNALTIQARRQEEDFVRWQADWEEKSRLWNNERQNLHNRVNLTENHLRSLVSGLQSTSLQLTDAQSRPSSRDAAHPTTPARATNTSSFQAHRRNESTTSNFSDRLAELSTPRSSRHIYSTEKSLADELNLDSYDPFDNDELAGDDEKIFVDDRAGEKTNKARKVLGLDSPRAKGGAFASFQDQPQHAEPLVSPITETPTKERPHHPQDPLDGLDRQVRSAQPSGYFPSRPLVELPTERASGLIPIADFENYVQAVEAPSHGTHDTFPRPLKYCDAATQCEVTPDMPVFEMEGSQKAITRHNLAVPSISIHPPSTAPNSPRQSMALLGAADAQTQTDVRIIRSMVDSEMQTEEIRIDRRKFDAYLLQDQAASGQGDKRPISMQSVMSNETFESVSVQEIVTDLATKAIRETAERTVMARSPRINESESALDIQNQSNFWGGQSVASSSMLISFHDEPGVQSGKSSLLWREIQKGHGRTDSGDSGLQILHENQQLSGDLYSPSQRDSSSKESSQIRPLGSLEQSRETPNLRTAFRSRGSSLDSFASGNSGLRHVPPFPVPTRSSSRIQSIDADDEAEGGPWPSPANGSPKSKRRTGGAHSAGVRKVRSGSNLARKAQTSPTRRRRPINRPAVYSTLYEDHPYEPSGSSSTRQPPEPESPLRMNPTRALTPVDEDNDAQVIDAIASAMVGEWVWKYASKRTSFGVGESSKKSYEDTNRQKRWIWVSPHDRTLMWSSKQPTSGAALLGRSSRKIRIKTVLDVKDETPAPKTSSNGMGCFNRSIVVLSPDRALKISATTMERHYLWLMALSFLANPGQGPPLIPRLSTSVKVPGLQQAQSEPHMDDSVIEQSVSRANANLLSQARSVSSPVIGEDWFSGPSPDLSYSLTASAEAALQPNETYRPDTANSANDIRPIARYPSTRSRVFLGAALRSSSTPIDLSAPFSALRSLTTRKPPSLRSVSSRNAKTNPLSPTLSSHSDHGSASTRANPALPLASTVRMTAFVEHDEEELGNIDVEEEHMAATGLGISTTPPELIRPRSRTLHPSPPKRLPPPAPRSASAREMRRPAEFALPYPGIRAADLESLSMATDEKRRMGYVFDDEGRDPFRGF